MNKTEFVNKYASGSETNSSDIRKVMMTDLNILINQILKEKEDKDFINFDSE